MKAWAYAAFSPSRLASAAGFSFHRQLWTTSPGGYRPTGRKGRVWTIGPPANISGWSSYRALFYLSPLWSSLPLQPLHWNNPWNHPRDLVSTVNSCSSLQSRGCRCTKGKGKVNRCVVHRLLSRWAAVLSFVSFRPSLLWAHQQPLEAFNSRKPVSLFYGLKK